MGILSGLKGWATRQVLRLSSMEGWSAFVSPTRAGVSVTPESALRNTPILRSVALLSETIAQLPIGVYEEESKKKAKHLPLSLALSLEPNPHMSSFTFREYEMNCVLMKGNFYAEIVRNGAGQVVELWPWRPDRVQMYKDDKGGIWYEYRPMDGKSAPVVLPEKDILHIRGAFTDGYIGKSLIEIAREAVGLSLAVEAYGAEFFGNGGRHEGALTTPNKLKQETVDRMKTQWKTRKTSRLLILEEGLEYKPFALSPEESQFLETRKFQVAEVARIFGIPPHMLGDLERATFSNIEHMGISLVTYSFMPWIKRIEQEKERKLLTKKQQGVLIIRFNVDGLLRGDIKSRYEAYAIAKNNGYMSANDIRKKENMPPIEGGDVYTVQVNTMPANLLQAFWQSKIDSTKSKEVIKKDEKSEKDESGITGQAS